MWFYWYYCSCCQQDQTPHSLTKSYKTSQNFIHISSILDIISHCIWWQASSHFPDGWKCSLWVQCTDVRQHCSARIMLVIHKIQARPRAEQCKWASVNMYKQNGGISFIIQVKNFHNWIRMIYACRRRHSWLSGLVVMISVSHLRSWIELTTHRWSGVRTSAQSVFVFQEITFFHTLRSCNPTVTLPIFFPY